MGADASGSVSRDETCLHDDDVVLIERIARDDSAAVADLYDRHSHLLYSLLVRMLRHRGEAEEVLQEVFLAVWSRARTYDRTLGSPVAWLVGIARNRAVDRLRANAVRQRTAEESRSTEADTADSPETQASLSERQRQIALALGSLPREQRQLIEDAYFLGLTQSELAARHRLPLGTVKTRIRTGMLTLRQQLSHLYATQ
jgi:RNA polymerase sigma-70 factor (ECF subfamily)